MNRLGVMGGAFNPPHNMHYLAGQLALEQFELDKVLFVPSGEPPHKKSELLDKELRFEMLLAGLQNNPRMEASRLEIDRAGPTWTIDTLYELRRLHGEQCRLYFIIGEDNLSAMESYDRKNEFLSLASLLVCPRLSLISQRKLSNWRRRLGTRELNVIDCPPCQISSTTIREFCRQERAITYLVPEAVKNLIDKHGHYKALLNRQEEKPRCA